MRNSLTLLALTSLAVWAMAHPTAAQTLPAAPKLQSLQADLQGAKDQEAGIVALISQGVEASKMLLTQHAALADQAKALQPEGETLRKELEAANSDAEKQRAAAAKHNAQCPHETTEAALVAKCNEAMNHLNAWASKVKAELSRLATAKEDYTKKLTEIAEHDKKILAELADLRTKDTAQRKQLAELHDHVVTLLSDVATARAQCQALEKAPADPVNAEALEACRAAKEQSPAAVPETK
jgi:chromosome segregation ATPase